MTLLQAEHLTFPCYTNTVLTPLSVSQLAPNVKHTRLHPRRVNQLHQLKASKSREVPLVHTHPERPSPSDSLQTLSHPLLTEQQLQLKTTFLGADRAAIGLTSALL